MADYKPLNQMLIDDVVYIPLYYSVGAFLIKPYVKGAGTNSFFDYYLEQHPDPVALEPTSGEGARSRGRPLLLMSENQ